MYFAQLGKTIKPAYAQLTNAAPGPTTLVTAGADEWIDIYSITVTSNDTVLETVTIDDGTNTVNVLYVGGVGTLSPVPWIFEAPAVPFRTKKGATIRATAGAVTLNTFVNVQVHTLVSKT